MNDDVQKYIYGAVVVFLVGVVIWFGIIFVNACGLDLSCPSGDLPVARTPIPTLIPATMPAAQLEVMEPAIVPQDSCYVSTANLFTAWVDAGSSQEEAFQFTDVNGQTCETSFAEVRPIFEKLSDEMVFVGQPLP
jgi:hypothetical protein